ncbi:MAG: FAD-dependent oxidoreductase, partial [Anaerolineae bacterium]|nr:FAD-dependent oxidoreductase [Anaerolineae bacterium]
TEIQPGTLMFLLSGYDLNQLDRHQIQLRYEQALVKGELLPGDYQHTNKDFIHFLQNRGSNAQHIHGADSSTASAHTKANIAGRQSLLRLLRFVRSLPGCEDTRIETMASETGIRETYRIIGEVCITAEQYRQGVVFPDAVSYTFYPIDLHTAQGITPQPLEQGVVPTIPLRAMIPRGSRNLLAAGRCISSDRLANSALRVQASCMAMGQAAGAAAVLAARQRISPAEVNYDACRGLLRKHQAIVP